VAKKEIGELGKDGGAPLRRGSQGGGHGGGERDVKNFSNEILGRKSLIRRGGRKGKSETKSTSSASNIPGKKEEGKKEIGTGFGNPKERIHQGKKMCTLLLRPNRSAFAF